MDIETKNARITDTMLGKECHGIMSCMIGLDYGGSGQGFGGYGFDTYNKRKGKRIGHAYGMKFIMGVLETVGVEKWEDLVGQHVRVKASDHKVFAIGHITEDKWFNPEEDLK